jgi:hypothetical protein
MRHASRVAGILILCSMVGVAFAGEVQLIADPSVPAATGKLNFEHDKNHNIKFHIDAKHLARPDALTPAKSVYVVWVKARGKDPQNAGILSVDQNLEGSFRGTTPYQTFDVFVTAEESPRVDYASGTQILHGTVQAQ